MMRHILNSTSHFPLSRKPPPLFYTDCSIRLFAVQELPWCAPKHSVKNRRAIRKKNDQDGEKLQPIDRFGIVAAMSKNRVIGTNGGIPWKCPRDVKNFKALTNSRILIIGRKTFNEHPNLVHVNHTRFCIVVSKSLDSLDVDSSENTSLQLVRSFPEALDLARELNDEYFEKVDNSDGANSNESLICWVGGGEAIYTEAIRHPSAAELHLSVLDIEIEPTREKDVAYFPSKYRWDNVFTEASKTYYPADTEAPFAPSFTYFIYKRKKPRPDHAIKL